MLTITCENVFVSYETKGRTDHQDADPTTRAYTTLTEAYDHFNRMSFGNCLPKCIITWQRKNKARGYFASRRFKTRTGDTFIDEIALNPAYFAERTTKEILSTLFHEMVHVWQQHHGTPSRTGYHNSEWAKKMEELGLIPSSTGEPGGDKTGQRVSHYIEVDGKFDRACNELLHHGANIEFVDRASTPAPKTGNASASRNKITYSCADCRTNTWGKPGLNLICGDCHIAFVAA
jgi:predicted SprT family Zn-dependent metalloprotease